MKKMKTTNKTFSTVAALTAVLLVTTALLTGCAEPVGVVPDGYSPGGGASGDVGYVRMSTSRFTIGRSIMPSAPAAFTNYSFSVEKFTSLVDPDPGIAISPPPDSTDLSALIALQPGFYEVTVTAHIGPGVPPGTWDTTTAVAKGTSARFQVTAGATQNVIVNITALDFNTYSEDGTFEYTIMPVPGSLSVNSFTMSITKLAGTGADNPITGANLTSKIGLGAQSQPLTAGAYGVYVELATNLGTAARYDVLYIYQNLTSVASYTFIPAEFGGGVTIIVNYEPPEDKRPIIKNGATTINNGGTESLTSTSLPANITVDNADAFDSIEWYCNRAAELSSTEGVSTTTVSSDTLTIGDTSTYFSSGKTYHITVVGYKDAMPYSTSFFVEVP